MEGILPPTVCTSSAGVSTAKSPRVMRPSRAALVVPGAGSGVKIVGMAAINF